LETSLKVCEAYQKYFDYFNQLTGKGLSIPEWQFEEKPDRIRAFLTGPYHTRPFLDESTALLIRQLRQSLVDRSLEIDSKRGEIVVRMLTR